MNIYPKTCERLQGLDNLMPFVEKYKGVEIQYFDKGEKMSHFDIASPIERLMERVSYIEEITVHPPLWDYDIEYIIFKDINIIKDQLKVLVELSRKYNIKLNIIYHTQWNFEAHKNITADIIKDLLKEIEGEKVMLLLENLYMFGEDTCSVFELANYIDHPNLRVCFDICHLYCKVNIYKTNIEDYIVKYLDKDICKKYIYQVHFSYTVDSDGYIVKETHGRGHRNIQDLEYDFNLMKRFGMDKCNYITEVSEDDYSSRRDQISEIEMLESIEK